MNVRRAITWLKPRWFIFKNDFLVKYDHSLYNSTYDNERTVEVPIIKKMIKPTMKVLEVGNVLSHYGVNSHTVVDKYEQAPGVINKDILNYDEGNYNLIVSISTIEHIGYDEDPCKWQQSIQAIDHLYTLLKPGGKLVFTIPAGYNRNLDKWLMESNLKLYFMERQNWRNEWRQIPRPAKLAKYGSPYRNANQVIICEVKHSR